MQPREFQRIARKRDAGEAADMALIMDVAAVRQIGDKYELLSIDLRYTSLETRAILDSAGIDISGRGDIGGGSGGRRGGTNPNLIVVQLDEQAFSDILNVTQPLVQGEIRPEDGAGIVVEGTREKELVRPSLEALRTYFRNRRVVVRGKPKLDVALVGARRDFRRKQVTLMVDNADDIVLLPRYNEDGEPVLSGPD
ncbi:hypothetical protein [Erythrobacter rubeus]|uniref:Uncharacterized protein n=1 Tax=Erythrobacter rubeus TaxID=2760803 RepID=A0ABR8KLH7_9SPHN|nr:hypothetical protein [Erythrobacter rubeus]MBD2841268.1 hypothetical protein [Erythrobacter rubeus]